MAVTQNSYTGNGSTTEYSFTFPYLKASEVKASIDATVTADFTLSNATTVKFDTAPGSGQKIKIYRETDDSALPATFYAGSSIKSEDLNDNFTQNLYSTQEVTARYLSNLGGTMVGDLTLAEDVSIIFEGATDDAFETTLTVADPTADRTITLPNETGTVITSAGTDVIDSAHYVAGSIDLEHMSANSVDSDQYVDGSIDLIHMSANSVDSDQYVDGSIDRVHLAADIIDGTKIANDVIDSEHYVAGSIDLEHMAADSVDSDQYVDGSIAGVHIANDAIDSQHYAAGSIDNEHIADNAIDSEHYADASIDTIHLANDAVTVDKLADNSVQSAQIVNGAVIEAKLSTGAVTNAKLGADAVDATKIADDAVTTDHIANVKLTTLAGMETGTASVLAGPDPLDATLTEINTICDGKGVQTTISDSDAHYPTSGAVVDYVAAQIAPLGGLEVIANEDSFPTQPASGVVISIADAGGIVVNGSGVSTTARTSGNGSDNVTINGFPSTLYSTTLTDNMGLLVSSTGSSNTYTYHKLLGKESDIKTLSDDINDFNARYRVASSAPGSDNDDGDLYFDTSTKKMKVYNAATSAWDDVAQSSSSHIVTLSESFNGSLTDFTMSTAATDAQSTIVSINGVIQKPNSGTSTPSEGFAISGNTLKLSNAPATGSDYFVVVLGDTVSIGTPSDNTVSTAKIQNLAVTGDKVATNLDLADSKKIRFGTGNDLEIYHDGSNSYISDTGTGDLYIKDTVTQTTGNYSAIHLETVSTGTADNDFATGIDFKVAGTNSARMFATKGGTWGILTNDLGSYAIKAVSDGTAELYYDNSKKFETTSSGVTVTGTLIADQLALMDSEKATFGDSNDLEIYHDGSNSHIKNSTNYLVLNSDNFVINNGADTEYMVKAFGDGAVELYYDNAKKFNTASDGGTLTGNLFVSEALQLNDSKKIELGSSADLQLYHDGTNNWIDAVNNHPLLVRAGTNNLYLQGNIVQFTNEGGSETYLKASFDGAVELYYDNVKQCETVDGGMNWADGKRAYFGNSSDLQIYHDGSNSYISDNGAGKLRLTTTGTGAEIDFTSQGGSEYLAQFIQDGAVKLYYDGGTYTTAKFETSAAGAKVTGYLFAHNNYADSVYTTQNKHVLQSDISGGVSLAVENSHDSNPYGLIVYFSDDSPDNNTNYFIHCADATESKLKIYSDGDVVNHDNAYGSISDVKLKENIVDAGSQWNDVKAVKVRNFNFKSDTPSDKRLGVVAQELETVSPGLVTTSPDLDIDNNDLGTTTKSVKYSILYMKAFKALQEAMAKIETLETKVAALEAK